MNRKLLPYERGLCQQLGLSEAQYLEFLAAQKNYSQSEAERREELRGDPVSIVLAVIGIAFQVASALLAPKPEQIKQKNQIQRRDKTFAPRIGFNGTQELAQYGQPINLIYCNQSINPNGALRVATSLLWSAVRSTGTGQYMQLLLMVGAAGVKRVDYNKTAFGQLPAEQFSASNTWMYYAEANGPVSYSQKVWGDDRDLAREAGGNFTHMVSGLSGGAQQGYSQAYTPTTMKDLGVYAPIPINVDVIERDEDGKIRDANIGIKVIGGYADSYSVGQQFTLKFNQVPREQEDSAWAVASEAAKDLRLQLVNNLDRGAIYRMGSADFKIRSVTDDYSLNKDDITAVFECTEPGNRPTCRYDRTKARMYKAEDKEPYNTALSVLTAPVKDDVPALTINDVAATGIDANKVSAGLHNYGFTQRQKTDRARKSTLYTQDISIPRLGGAGGHDGANKDYSFVGTETLTWLNDLDKQSTFTYPKGGSIAYSELLLELFLADKPKLSTKALRKEYSDDLKKLREYRDDLRAGKYKAALREDIKRNDPTCAHWVARIEQLDLEIGAINGEAAYSTWRAEARAATQWRFDRIKYLRREFIKDPNTSAKKLADVEDKIEDLRKDARDYIRDYIEDRQAASREGQSKEGVKQKRREKTALQDQLRDRVAELLDDWRVAKVREARVATYAFTGYDGNRYASGVNGLVDKLDDLRGEWTTDQVGVDAVRKRMRELIAEKRKAQQWVKYVVKNWETLIRDVDDNFYCKAIVKMAKAVYQTVTTCHVVRFNFRVRLFRRITGRAKQYGEHEAPDGYKLSDNGLNRRTMFFSMLVRKNGEEAWAKAPVVFAVERGNDADHYISLHFSSAAKAKRQFRFIPIVDPVAEINENGFGQYAYIYNAGVVQTLAVGDGNVEFYGRMVALDWNKFPDLKERGPMYTNEWDMFSIHSDTQVQASYDNGPEASLINVTEQTVCTLDAQKYRDMSLLAFHTYASQGVDDLRSISTYVLEGKAAWKINESSGQRYQSGNGACYAPDIFTDTVMDGTNGIANFANANAVDWQRLALAKRFCKNNGLGTQLFMDGVIADRRGWREFWAEVAPYSLLEFARMNGKETLIPALPCNESGVATTSLTISALFNEGNILEDSYKEDYIDYGDNTKDLVATVIYRETSENEVFPRNMSVTLSRRNTNAADAVWQTFDLSDWVSNRRQAVLYGRYLCQQRRYVGRTIEFKTVPTDSPVQPGAYIYVDIGLKRWDSVRTGVVKEGGVLDLPLEVGIADGTYTVMTYDSKSDPVVHQSISITDGVATGLSAAVGSLFVLGTSSDARRVFRVVEVSLNEDAELTVSGVEHPCSINGATTTSLVADLSDGLFKEIGVDCP